MLQKTDEMNILQIVESIFYVDLLVISVYCIVIVWKNKLESKIDPTTRRLALAFWFFGEIVPFSRQQIRKNKTKK